MTVSEESFTNIPATCDFMFKYIFGSEKSQDILKSFINAFQQASGQPEVTELTLLNPCTPKTWLKEKDSIVDVLCRDMTGSRFTIEMQAMDHAAFLDRTLYYWAKVYASQMIKGDDYTELRPVIGINIANFSLFPYNKRYHNCFKWANTLSPRHYLSGDCVIHYLELPKIPVNPQSLLEAWNSYLKLVDRGDREMVKTLEERCAAIAEAHRRYEEANQDIEARSLYEGRLKFRMVNQTILNAGRREALAEGLAEGRAEGRAEGERAALMKTAAAMKNMGLPPDQIQEATGLDPENIEKA